MIINIIVFLLLIPGDAEDLNNYLEPILLTISIAGLLSMKKAGAAFATAVLCITLGTSMFNVIYYGAAVAAVGYLNGLRVVLNAAAAIYMFKLIFANKFR